MVHRYCKLRCPPDSPELVLLGRQPVDEDGEPLPAHLAALLVEVKGIVPATVGSTSKKRHVLHSVCGTSQNQAV